MLDSFSCDHIPYTAMHRSDYKGSTVLQFCTSQQSTVMEKNPLLHSGYKYALITYYCLKHDVAFGYSIAGNKMRSAQTELKNCQEYELLTCEETYSTQSSSFDSIGIKPSLFTDKAGEFSFCKHKEKTWSKVISKHERL